MEHRETKKIESDDVAPRVIYCFNTRVNARTRTHIYNGISNRKTMFSFKSGGRADLHMMSQVNLENVKILNGLGIVPHISNK